MRILKVNGINVDIDDNTAIGITFQAYDVSNPGKRKVNYSNSFTLPKTVNNLKTFGFPGSIFSIDTIVYDSLPCEYYIDNYQVFKNAKIQVQEVGERITVFIYDKLDIWEQLKLVKWFDFQTELFNWLTIPKKGDPILDTFANFLYPYTISTSGIKLPYYYSNLFGNELVEGGKNYIETPSQLFLKYNQRHGGHFCIYIKTIFEFIESKYNVNFLTNESIIGNIWDDYYAQKIYMPFRRLDVSFNYSDGVVNGFYFELPKNANYTPHDKLIELNDKSVFDVLTVFFQTFNIIIDKIDNGEYDKWRLSRFDDLENSSIIDWSGNLTGDFKFKPSIENYAQENYIKISTVYENGAETEGQRTLTCLNKNIDSKSDLFSIDTYYPNIYHINNKAYLNLSVEDSFSVPIFLIDSDDTEIANVYCSDELSIFGASLSLPISAFYSISNEYLLIDRIIKYPKYYTVKKWLKLKDIIDFKFFNQYYIKELGGCFFVNKISNYNPNKSNVATEIELIKINDKTPVYPSDLEYYVDGINDYFKDGIGDYWH